MSSACSCERVATPHSSSYNASVSLVSCAERHSVVCVCLPGELAYTLRRISARPLTHAQTTEPACVTAGIREVWSSRRYHPRGLRREPRRCRRPRGRRWCWRWSKEDRKGGAVVGAARRPAGGDVELSRHRRGRRDERRRLRTTMSQLPMLMALLRTMRSTWRSPQA